MAEKPQVQPNQPHFYQHKKIGLLVAALLILKVITLILPASQPLHASDLTPSNILNAVNKERSLRNLTLLNTNTKLTAAAESKSEDMIARKYFAHVDPDGHYIWDKIVADGYTPYAQLGENLAIEFYDTDSLMAAWMNSPTHRANILQEGFRDQGMAVSFGDVSQGQYYSAITNTFGTLAIAKPGAAPSPTRIPAPKPQPKINPAPSPTPQIPSVAEVLPPSSPTTEPTTPTLRQPLALRTTIEQGSSFALPSKADTATSPSASPAAVHLANESASAVIGAADTANFANYEVNRYLVLIGGVILLLLMGTDIKRAFENKLGSLDKKINNAVLLLIAMIVIAFMYWL